MKQKLLTTLLAIISSAWASGCGGDTSSRNSAAAAAADGSEAISAGDLYKAYTADARNAELKYKGKILKVTGTAHSFKQEGDASILQIFVYGEGTSTFNVSCTSNEPQWVKDVTKVKLSRPVTFIGTFNGFGNMAANFDKCHAVSSQ